MAIYQKEAKKSSFQLPVRAKASQGQTGVHVIPFIRQGILLDISPNPNKEQASKLVNRLTKDWKQLQEEHRKIVVSAIAGEAGEIQFGSNEEQPWDVWEGNITLTLSYPLIQLSNNGSESVATRLCVSVCTGKRSTKVWTRAGMDSDMLGTRLGASIEELEDKNKIYRKVTQDSCEWMVGVFKALIEELSFDLQVLDQRLMEVSCLGVRDDEVLASHLEQLSNNGIAADEILEEREAYERFSFYFSKFADMKFNLLDKGLRWFSSPTTVEVANHYLEPREALYLVNPCNEKISVIGLAYDDSISGELSHRSVTKVARELGMKI